jgi:hypothetical protein
MASPAKHEESIGGRNKDEFAPQDRQSRSLRVSRLFFLGMSTELFIRPGMLVP